MKGRHRSLSWVAGNGQISQEEYQGCHNLMIEDTHCNLKDFTILMGQNNRKYLRAGLALRERSEVAPDTHTTISYSNAIAFIVSCHLCCSQDLSIVSLVA